jgi:Uma2 family endonuclease
MGQALLQLPMTAAEFLVWDETQTVKHEFLAGEVFAMVGATKTHGALTLNIAMALRRHLRGTPCSTFVTDIKLQVQAANAYFYPDVLVTCSAADRSDPKIVREPSLVVEVLSPSTAAYDVGGKFAAYRQLHSLKEMVFIDPDSHRCDVYRKGSVETNGGLWVLHPFEPDQDVRFASVELDLPASLLWEGLPAALATPIPSDVKRD